MKPLNLFNKKYAGLLVFVVVLIVVVRLYFLDAWLKAGIIGAGQAAVGAKVEVKSAHLAVLSGHVRIKGLSVGDRLHPFRNLVEVKLIDLDLSPRALLSGQVYVQNAQVSGIALGTARKTSAALKKKAPAKPKNKTKPRKLTKIELEAQQETKKTVAYYSWNAIQARLGLGALMDTSAFQFANKLNSTSKELNAWPGALQAQLVSPNIEEQLQLVQKQWDALSKAMPNDIAKLPAYLKQVQLLQTQLGALNDLVLDKQKKINYATQFWQNQVDDLNRQAAKDLSAVQDKIRSVQSMPSGAMKDVMGDQYLKVIATVKDKVDMVLSKVKPKPKKIPWYQRFWVKGDTIDFPIYERRPKFLIEHVQCDGVFGRYGDAFVGTIDEIASQQGVRNKPMRIHFQTKDSRSPRQFSVDGVVDLRRSPAFAVSGVASGFPVGKSYWDINSIPLQIDQGLLGLKGQLSWTKGQLSLGTNVRADGLVFSKTSTYRADDLFHHLMSEVAKGASWVELKVRFEKGLLSMDSNLDEALARAMNEVIDQEKQKWMKLAEAQWDSLVGEPIRGVEKQFQGAKNLVDQQWQDERKKIDAQVQAIQDDIDKQLKSLQNQTNAATQKALKEVDVARSAAEAKANQATKEAADAADQAKRAEEAKAKAVIDQQKLDAQKAIEDKLKGLKLF